MQTTHIQPSLAQELEEGKKEKKKKIALDFVAAEVASLVASGGIEETPHPPPSTPQLDEESQRTGATPLGVTEPGMEEHGYLLHSQTFPPSSLWSLIGTLEAIKNWMMGRPGNEAIICLLPFTCIF